MKTGRREFLQRSVVTGLAATVSVRADALPTIDTSATSGAPVPPFDLEESSVAELQQSMSAGKLTSRAITEKYLTRIEALDRRGPAVNSVIEVNPDALALAEASDKERKAK